MIKILPILILERLRRIKAFIHEKPVLSVCLAISAVFAVYELLTKPFNFGNIFTNQMVVLIVMLYIVAKIINPTQGMVTDYQLIELKLISLVEYKFLIGLKLIGGSIFISLFCLSSYNEIVAIICALNITVNVWVFLRNRWNSRIYDFIVAIIVIVAIRYELLYLSLVSMILMVLAFMIIRRVNYESILPLYKLMYGIGQQRFNGVSYSEKESRGMQSSAESLIGKAKERTSSWCEKFYDTDRKFYFYKEVTRIISNKDKYIAYLIISILIGVCSVYLPNKYMIVAFAIIVSIAFGFDVDMNKPEANLLQRGYIEKYDFREIVKNKLFVYWVANAILMLPSVLLGWKVLLLSFIISFITSFIALCKCLKK